MSAKVMLLEDHQFGHQFRHVFGTCDHYYTVGELAGASGSGWDYAFIDFELANNYTGLGALLYLREYSPETKIITFTATGERGRTLFALAAKRWFGAWALLDKGLAGDDTLEGIRAGINPTTPQWDSKLATSGWMINMLFRRPLWLQMWRLWPTYDGSVRALKTANPELGPAAIREFSEQAPEVVAALQATFFPTEITLAEQHTDRATGGKRGYAKRAVPLSAFGRTHSNFFNAPELPEVLEFAEPWSQRSY